MINWGPFSEFGVDEEDKVNAALTFLKDALKDESIPRPSWLRSMWVEAIYQETCSDCDGAGYNSFEGSCYGCGWGSPAVGFYIAAFLSYDGFGRMIEEETFDALKEALKARWEARILPVGAQPR